MLRTCSTSYCLFRSPPSNLGGSDRVKRSKHTFSHARPWVDLAHLRSTLPLDAVGIEFACVHNGGWHGLNFEAILKNMHRAVNIRFETCSNSAMHPEIVEF